MISSLGWLRRQGERERERESKCAKWELVT
jgi:hypothetical protein